MVADEDVHRHAVENSTKPMPYSLAGDLRDDGGGVAADVAERSET
jgi:hypothetical protein